MDKSQAKLANGIHRAKTWEIGLYALNNLSTNLYMFIFMYISYFLTGIIGASVVFAGTLITVMRMWDGVTDPIIGYFLDKTNGKFGKNRPFIFIGNIILFITSFIIFKFTPSLPQLARIPFFIVMYMLYIIGYTCQCVVTKSAQTCMTNDPKQRPVFAMFDMIYVTLTFALFPVLITNFLMPRNGGADAFSNRTFFMELWAIGAFLSFFFAILAIIGIWRKDKTEYFGTGKSQKITIRDYWEVLRKNRAIQMLVISAASDKLSLTMMSNSVVFVMLFGIIVGNYEQYGLMSAVTSIPTILIQLLLMRLIAVRLGQKKAMVVGTWGGIITAVLTFLLFRFGQPRTLDFSFSSVSFFTIAFLILTLLMRGFSGVASNIVIPMTADCADYEVYRSGKYVPGLMGTLFSFVDKMISSLSTTFVSLLIAAIGFKSVQPTPETPYSEGIFWVTMICFLGAPLLGWICNVIAMKFYPLNNTKMAEIQSEIARIKSEHKKESDN